MGLLITKVYAKVQAEGLDQATFEKFILSMI